MRREAIKVPSILGMHETPMSTRSMRMFRTIVQGRLDRGSLKTQICHGLGTGAVVANCEGNELPEKRTVAWPATGRLATSHVRAIRRGLASCQHPATTFRVLQRRLQRSHHAAATILQLSCCISTETAPAQWRHYTISGRAAGRERLYVQRTVQSGLRQAARPGWPMAGQSTQLSESDDRLVRRAIAQSAKTEPQPSLFSLRCCS